MYDTDGAGDPPRASHRTNENLRARLLVTDAAGEGIPRERRCQGRTADALEQEADEGRGKLR